MQVQFYKLLFMIDTHYRSMLFANAYSENTDGYKSEKMMEIDSELLRDRFCGVEDRLIDAQIKPPLRWNALLPHIYRSVMVECWWFANGPEELQVCRMPFCAETEMAEVAKMKARCEGRNTDKFGELNMHNWPFPSDRQNSGFAALALDRTVNYCGKRFRALDMIHTVATREGNARLYVDDV